MGKRLFAREKIQFLALLIPEVMKKPPKIFPLIFGVGVTFIAIPAYSQACTVNNTSNGSLTLSNPSQLVANDQVGTPGNLNITCSAGTTFTITNVINNGTPSAINNLVDGVFAAIRSGNNIIARGEISPSGNINPAHPPGTNSVIQTAPIIDQEYAIDLSVFITAPQLLPAGSYAYRVNILLTPQ